MKELFRKKSGDFNMIQDGMKKIKDFQKKKAQMEQELNDVRKKQRIKCFFVSACYFVMMCKWYQYL